MAASAEYAQGEAIGKLVADFVGPPVSLERRGCEFGLNEEGAYWDRRVLGEELRCRTTILIFAAVLP